MLLKICPSDKLASLTELTVEGKIALMGTEVFYPFGAMKTAQ